MGIIAASNDLVIDPQNDNGNKEWWETRTQARLSNKFEE